MSAILERPGRGGSCRDKPAPASPWPLYFFPSRHGKEQVLRAPSSSRHARTCIRCGTAFVAARSDKFYCSTKCVKVASAERNKERGRLRRAAQRANPTSGFPAGTYARFMKYVEKQAGEDGCWDWTGYAPGGRGRFTIDNSRSSQKAHRVSYEMLIGPIPAGHILHHRCERPICVNPSHLVPMLQPAHALIGNSPPAQNARKTHCVNGHPLGGDNLYVGENGYRSCQICRRAATERSNARRSEARRLARESRRNPQQGLF